MLGKNAKHNFIRVSPIRLGRTSLQRFEWQVFDPITGQLTNSGYRDTEREAFRAASEFLDLIIERAKGRK